MNDGRYVLHVTLTTGHARRSYRDEVDDAIVAILRQQIAEMRAGLPVEIRPGYRLTGAAAGQALVASVSMGDVPMVTIGVAGNAKVSARLWDQLKVPPTPLIAGAVGEPPRAPWCAVTIHPTILDADPATLGWLGDFERCLAWAWIERQA